jgi:NIPSNAP
MAIVEERIYTLHPGKIAAYLQLYEQEGLAIQRPILGELIGYFSTEIGPLNQIVHLWRYQDMADRASRRATLTADPDWKTYIAKVQPMIREQENKVLIPAPFSPLA